MSQAYEACEAAAPLSRMELVKGIEPSLPAWKAGILAIGSHELAGKAGLEPATLRLTAGCSTIELHANI